MGAAALALVAAAASSLSFCRPPLATPPAAACRHDIRLDPLTGPEIAALLEEHVAEARRHSPPGSSHALDLDRLRGPDFWSAWDGGALVGCVALKQLDSSHGEVKSMRTAAAHQRKGIGARLLQHVLDEAARRGYRQVSLETGALAHFHPARSLYARFGFAQCGPFAQYRDDPNSVFMTRAISRTDEAPARA